MTPSILSIQSHVVYGYVGNKAATFPLQSLGFDVWPINTVQFSNHTGYGQFQGEAFSSNHVINLIQGIEQLDIFSQCAAILSGYLGSNEMGHAVIHAVEKVRSKNAETLYLCDPVIGDTDRGVFVKPGILEFFRDEALNHANIITPNHFEAQLLCGQSISTLDDAKTASKWFHERGIQFVLFTSFLPTMDDSHIRVFLSTRTNFYIAQTPRVAGPSRSGTGDLFSALFLGHFLRSSDPVKALTLAMSDTYQVIRKTELHQQRELQILSQNYDSPLSTALTLTKV